VCHAARQPERPHTSHSLGPKLRRSRGYAWADHLALDRADEAVNRIVPIERSNTWEGAVGRIKWVMDTLGPIAEVSVLPFDVLGRANFHTQLSPLAKMAHGLLLAIPKARPFCHSPNEISCYVRLDDRHSWNSMNVTTMSTPYSKPCMTHLILQIMRTL
jgi:hypothetical protein